MNEMFKEYMLSHSSYTLKDQHSLEMIHYLKKTYEFNDEDFLVKKKNNLLVKNFYVLTSSSLYYPSSHIDIKGLISIKEKELKTYLLHYEHRNITVAISEDIYKDLCVIIEYYEGVRSDADALYMNKDYENALELYSELYYQGYKDILENIGDCYKEMGNMKKALEIYTHVLENLDDHEEYYNKAKDLFKNKDYVKAYVYFKKAMECGYTKAGFYIGRIYHYGFVFDKDLDKAKRYYNEALVHYNDERIHYHMAMLYRELKDYENMHTHLNLSPQERIPYFKGKLYHKGIGVKKDLKKAKKYYEESLTYSFKAYYPLASVSLETRNYEDYFKYLTLAYDHGDKRVYNHLGLAYEKGRGVLKDYKQALYYYNLALNEQSAYAYFNLARMYKEGKGVEKDLDKAISLLETSAALNFGGAYSELGKMYLEGTLDHDIEKGIRYIEKGLSLGSENAKVYMAILSIEGKYVKEDVYYAYQLLKDALKNETNGNNAKRTFIHYVLEDVFHLELDELSEIFDYAVIVKHEESDFIEEFNQLVSYYKEEFIHEYIKGCAYNTLTNALFFYKDKTEAHFIDVLTNEDLIIPSSKLKSVRHALSTGSPVHIEYEDDNIISVKLSYEESLIK